MRLTKRTLILADASKRIYYFWAEYKNKQWLLLLLSQVRDPIL
ncbi:hypothetical protein LV83_03852 [Algoriphagus yeomjeoni]|uniref:Uncharacterized protein n=1 Tax=Algoriphagus yeomjeoni TaxID=291403 RepID=A0A327P191_9BACT|nr:hypothetical protein LV83_03852 [Algoriphagus yeomjeoni]